MKNSDRQLIFVDDSGDPGFSAASSANFVMACIVFTEQEAATKLNDEITCYRKELNWNVRHEFKFNKTPKKIIKNFLKIVCKYDFKIYSVYFIKSSCLESLRSVDSGELYNWSIEELLKLIPLNEARINIDGRSSRTHRMRVAAYLRKSLNRQGQYRVKEIRSKDSKEDNLIQLADIIAGSINRYLQIEKTDSEEYINIIKNKIVKLESLGSRSQALQPKRNRLYPY